MLGPTKRKAPKGDQVLDLVRFETQRQLIADRWMIQYKYLDERAASRVGIGEFHRCHQGGRA